MALGLRILLLLGGIAACKALTDPNDVAVLTQLQSSWASSPAVAAWPVGTDPCIPQPWTGLNCSLQQDPATVVGLDLKAQGLSGMLPDPVWSLTNLKNLNLGYNAGLEGTISSAVGRLAGLTKLALQSCSLTGTLPTTLGSLLSLTYLSVRENHMGGPIPVALTNLSKLWWFDITMNSFSGPLPENFSTISTLGHMHMAFNQLTSLPSGITTLQNLDHLLIDNNAVVQPFPPGLLDMNFTTIISISNNTWYVNDSSVLEGRGPAIYEFFARNALKPFPGRATTIPLPDFSRMPQLLEILDLGENTLFSGPIPNSIGNLTGLYTLRIDGNNLTGGIPLALSALSKLEKLNASDNSLSDPVPAWVATLKQLELNLDYNGIEQVALATLNQPDEDNQFKILLAGNPVCEGSDIEACKPPNCTVVWTNMAAEELCDGETRTKCEALTALSPSENGGVFLPSPADYAATNTCVCVSPLRVNTYLNYTSFAYFTLDRAAKISEITAHVFFNKSKGDVNLSPSQIVVSRAVQVCSPRFLVTINIYPPAGQLTWDVTMLRKIMNLFTSSPGYLDKELFGVQYVDSFTEPAEAPYSSSGSTLSAGAIAGIAVGCVAFVALLVGLVAFWANRQARLKALRERDPLTPEDLEWLKTVGLQGGMVHYEIEQLEKATDNFSDALVLGEGGYGKVYRGVLPPGVPEAGTVVAVKRAKTEMLSGGAEFRNEIELLSRVHHRNLVGLKGFCRQVGEQLLVYELISRGTLSDWVNGKAGKTEPLTFKRRLHIALGAAKGLAYLHSEVQPSVIHRDIKCGNILLDDNFNAKVADFGLSKAVEDEESDRGMETKVKGTAGYLDPEYYLTDLLTEKSDVYSFGIVLLELATGWRVFEGNMHIRGKVLTVVNETGIMSVAAKGIEEAGGPQVEQALYEQVFEEFVRLGMVCCTKKASMRPTMREVQAQLEELNKAVSGEMGPGGRMGLSNPSNGTGGGTVQGGMDSGSATDMVFSVDEDDEVSGMSYVERKQGTTSQAGFSAEDGAFVGPDGELYDNSGIVDQSEVIAK